MITKISLGMKDEMANPKNDETTKCFLMGFISSSFTLRTIIEEINPTVKIQKRILIKVFMDVEAISCVMDCSQ